MSNIREHLDILEFNNLSEDDQRDLAHMVLNNMHQDLEEWAQLREIDMGKIKKWIKTGALAAALAGAGISAAHAQDADWMRKHGGNQQQMQQRGQDQGQFQQRGGVDMRGNAPGQAYGRIPGDQGGQRWDQGRDQRGQDQGRWQQRGGVEMRGNAPGQAWGRIPGLEQYQHWQQDRGEAQQWAHQRGGWEPRPRWHLENPWAMIDIEPPEEALYFRDNGNDIMFIPHPRRMDLMRARELGGMIETLQVPYWPEPIRAFVYEMDGVTYITALPGQLP